jgi:hypothetical protein
MASALLLLALPQLMPIPLGVSNLLALPVVAVAAQLAIGRREPWLPAWLLERRLHRETVRKACGRLVPPLRRSERLIRPRLPMVWSWWSVRVIGAGCLVLSLVALAPLPLTGWLPGWAIVLIALGLLERDGLVALAGLALGTLAIGVFAAAVAGLIGLSDRMTAQAFSGGP